MAMIVCVQTLISRLLLLEVPIKLVKSILLKSHYFFLELSCEVTIALF
jgi:hypothetical protein